MAIGADRGILVETDVELQPLAVAKLLKALCDKEQPQLVVCGKQAIDDDANQTGQMLAALAGWPQATFASKVVVAEGKATVNPAIAAKTTGMRHKVSKRVVGSSRRAPKEKCSVFSTMNRITAAGSAFSPQASTASGRPMLPELLNSIGGTSVLGWMPNSRATGQASRPQVASTRKPPSASGA